MQVVNLGLVVSAGLIGVTMVFPAFRMARSHYQSVQIYSEQPARQCVAHEPVFMFGTAEKHNVRLPLSVIFMIASVAPLLGFYCTPPSLHQPSSSCPSSASPLWTLFEPSLAMILPSRKS